MSITKNIFLFSAAALSALLLSANTVYTWTDENGVVHFSQTAPEENPDQADQTFLRSAPKTGGTFADIPAEADAEGTDESDANSPEQQIRATPKEQYQKDPAKCERAREMLANLDTGRQLRIRDPDTGEVSYASAQDLEVQRERALAAVDKDC